LFCFFLFRYNFVSFYLFVNNLFFSFLIWNFLCCFKKISSHVSHFFSTIFSSLKLVCSFWQIARLQEFFINYRIGSHKHLDKLWINCCCRHSLSSSSSIIFFFRDEELGWMDDRTDGWKGRPDTTASEQNQGYYISRLHFIYQIFHFKHYKSINIENSYFIEILFKWNDLSFFFFKFNNVHSYIYFPLKIKNHLNKKKSWISLFNSISMTIILKKKSLINGFFFVNIIILLMLSYFQLLYDYFSLI